MLNKRIIILGVDGSGKTTLAHELCKRINAVYYKDFAYKHLFFGNPDYTWHVSWTILQLMPLLNQNFVFDRFFHDEFVYGKVLNRSFNGAQFNMLLKMCQEQNFKVIYVQRPMTLHRLDELIDEKFRPELVEAYKELFEKYKIPFVAVSGLIPFHEQYDYIKEFIN